MDWAAVASILADRSERPITCLDQHGYIRIFNRAMEQVLGWRRFEVEGEQWGTRCTPAAYRDEAQCWISNALRGALSSFEARGLAKSGTHVVLGFEFALVGRGESQGVLATVTHWRPAESSKQPTSLGELDYDVTIDAGRFGTLSRLIVDSQRVDLEQEARCFEAIHGLQQPCHACPLQNAEEPWPRVDVQPIEQPGATEAAFQIRSADRTEAGLVRIRTRTLTERTLEAIHSAKIQKLADRAALSPREREVLMYILHGRTVDDIGSVLGIAVRTVKYHQANVLQKLGADSRHDLLRLLF